MNNIEQTKLKDQILAIILDCTTNSYEKDGKHYLNDVDPFKLAEEITDWMAVKY